MAYLVLIGIVLAIPIIYLLRIYITKNYLFHQYKLGIGNQYREFTKEYFNINYNKTIDEETFADFEMPEILKKINYTYCEIGNEYLYNCFFSNNNDFISQEKIIVNLDNDKSLKEVIYQLNRLNKDYIPILSIKSSLEKFPVKYGLIVIICLLLSLASIIATIINLDYFIFIIIIALLSLMLNSRLSENTGKISLQVSLLNEMIQIMNKLIKTNIFPEPNRNEITKAFKELKKITKISYYLNIFKEIDIFSLLEIIKALFFIDIIQAFLLTKKVDQVHKDVLVFYENIGLLDTCITIKVVRSLYDTCIPEVLNEERIIIKDGYHLLIDKPVKNSISLDDNAIITGSNASGKSTFLKMVGANILLAKSLNLCFAESFKYYPYDLISSIHMKDDIISGDSFYVKEIKRLYQITKQANQQKSLILIDEILKGTNEQERIIIARSLLNYLFNSISMTIVSTHDIELTKDFDDIKKYCFNDIKTDNSIIFDYQINEGICTIGNAIAIVNSLPFQQSILDNIKEQEFD